MFVSVLCMVAVSSCKKTEDPYDEVTEPITLIKPNSTTVTLSENDALDIEIKYTTDRAINYVQTLYQIDTSGLPGFVYTYPDTLANIILDANSTELTNRYTYTGSYNIPDSLPNNTKIRFKTSFKAGTLQYNKEFKILVDSL